MTQDERDSNMRMLGARDVALWARWARKSGVYGVVKRERARAAVSAPPVAWIDRWKSNEARRWGIAFAADDRVDSVWLEQTLVGDPGRGPVPWSQYYTMTEGQRADVAMGRGWRSPTPEDSLREQVAQGYVDHPGWGPFDAELWSDLARPSSWEVLQVRAPPAHPGEFVDDSWSGDGPLVMLAREIARASERDRWIVFNGGDVGDYGKILSITIS